MIWSTRPESIRPASVTKKAFFPSEATFIGSSAYDPTPKITLVGAKYSKLISASYVMFHPPFV